MYYDCGYPKIMPTVSLWLTEKCWSVSKNYFSGHCGQRHHFLHLVCQLLLLCLRQQEEVCCCEENRIETCPGDKEETEIRSDTLLFFRHSTVMIP